MRPLSLLVATALLLSPSSTRADTKSQDTAGDEQLLKAAGVSTEGPALVHFFRKRSLTEEGLTQLEETVRRLGDESFSERERASRELREIGRPAVSALQRVLTDPDLEVRHRAARCLSDIGPNKDAGIVLAAARLLAVKKPTGSTAALLGFLPFADDDLVEEELLGALATVARQDGTLNAALTRALTDKAPERRGAAAHVLASTGDELHLMAARAMLADTSPKVRLRTAQGLIAGKQKDGIPALVALLNDAPLAQAWQAEELLCRLAGDKAPSSGVAGGSPEERRKCRDAWAIWWREQGPTLDLGRLALTERQLGLTLVVAYDGYNQGRGRVFEMGLDGRVRWQIDDVRGPVDAQVLAGNRVLIAEYNAGRFSERTLDGKVVWERAAAGSPINCRRLPNGNTFLATTTEMREITADGKNVFEITGRQIYSAYKLPTGNVAYLSVDGSLIELDAHGKEVRKFSAGAAPIGLVKFGVLPAGRFLVPQQTAGKVREYDSTGKILWEGSIPNARVAARLPNGNTLICGHNGDHRVAEVSRAGRVVWEKRLEGHAHSASRR